MSKAFLLSSSFKAIGSRIISSCSISRVFGGGISNSSRITQGVIAPMSIAIAERSIVFGISILKKQHHSRYNNHLVDLIRQHQKQFSLSFSSFPSSEAEATAEATAEVIHSIETQHQHQQQQQQQQQQQESQTPSQSTTAKSKRRPPATPRKDPITITPSAADRIAYLLEKSNNNNNNSNPAIGIRLGTKKRGCNGLSYTLNYAYQNDINESNKKNYEIMTSSYNGVKVLIEPMALLNVVGTTMDWKEDDMTSEFTFENPNSKGECGCGESFNV